MSDLPPRVRADLDRAAAGHGRTPTHAHPDCVCGLRPCPRCGAGDEQPCAPTCRWEYRSARSIRPRECPQHRTDPS